MPRFTCDADFSDIPGAFKDLRRRVRREMERVGGESVDYAVQNGTYPNRTGKLRSSNRYEADDEKLSIINDAPYASDVEARGHDVISGAALFAEERLKEIFE